MSKTGFLGKRCKRHSVDIEEMSIEGGRSNILHTTIYSSKYLPALSPTKAIVLTEVKAIVPMLLFDWFLASKNSLGWKLECLITQNIRRMTPKETLRLWCIHMAQLITHAAFIQELLTLQLCYKPFGILQTIIKS